MNSRHSRDPFVLPGRLTMSVHPLVPQAGLYRTKEWREKGEETAGGGRAGGRYHEVLRDVGCR